VRGLFVVWRKVMAVIKTVNAAAEKALVEVRAAVKQAGASGVVMPVAP